MMILNDCFELLGKKVEDKITGFRGIVTSISFDLYGCIQILVNPGLGKDYKFGEQAWLDIGRLKVISNKPVMNRPDFLNNKGPAEKPQVNKV